MVDPNVNFYPTRSHHVSGSSIPGRNSSLLVYSTTNSVDQSQDSGCFDNSAIIKNTTNEEIEEGLENDANTSNFDYQSFTPIYVDRSPKESIAYDSTFMGYYRPIYSPLAQSLLYAPSPTHQPPYVQLANLDPQMQYYLTNQQFAAGPPTQYISSEAHNITVSNKNLNS